MNQTSQYQGVSFDTIRQWYAINHQGRLLEDRAVGYIRKAKGWSYHAPFAGHDGIQLILGQTFRPNKDFLFPYYRDLLTSLAAGLTAEEIILNGLSKENDVAGGGRHMSNHFAKPSVGVQNVSSCTGNHTLHAAGVARAIKYYHGENYTGEEIAFSSQGEASTSEGYVYEALNGASREKLPVIFVIQNNGYGISVPVSEQSANRIVSENYKGLKNLLVVNVDGTDHFDCYRGMQEALEYVSAGSGPVLLHAECVRIGAHSNSDNHILYRSEEERKEVLKHDPLDHLRALMLEQNIATEDELLAIETENEKVVQAACDAVEQAADPDPSSVEEFAWPPLWIAPETPTPQDNSKWKIREAINETLHAEFNRNPDTFLWGQDVASKEKGGVFNVTKNMQQAFGRGRVFNGPIAEDYIVGTANGMSRYGDHLRIVIEAAQFADYVWPAMEQLVETGHEYWRTKGQFSPNITLRLSSGGYIGGGLYHSQNVEAIFSHLPGIRVVTPAFADDAAGLLRSCIRSQGITFFLEPKFLYNQPFAATPRCDENHVVPIGKARIRRSGSDITVISWGTPVHWSLRAANKMAKQGVEVEVIDLRSIRPWDFDTVAASVKKTGKVVIVHEDHLTQGFGAEISATLSEHLFEWLDAPICRVAAKDIPVGFSRILERATLPYEEDVLHALQEIAKY
jgi:2-oxoisovalerate dehydrogenase E1 component